MTRSCGYARNNMSANGERCFLLSLDKTCACARLWVVVDITAYCIGLGPFYVYGDDCAVIDNGIGRDVNVEVGEDDRAAIGAIGELGDGELVVVVADKGQHENYLATVANYRRFRNYTFCGVDCETFVALIDGDRIRAQGIVA